MKHTLISAISMVVILVAVLSFAAGIRYADSDDDVMQYTVKDEDREGGSSTTISESESLVRWTVDADGTTYISLRPAEQGAKNINLRPAAQGTKYINLRPAVQDDPVSSPSRQPDTAPNCDGIDCQQNG